MKKLQTPVTLALAALVLAAAGCGASSSSDSSPQDADRQALTEISQKLGPIAEDKDAAAYCDLFEPNQLQAGLGSRDQCIRVFRPLLKQSTAKSPFVIADIEFDGDEALVTYEGDNGTAAFVKVNGEWYARAPSIDSAVSKGQADQ